jgi:Ribbon-helix-helix domain
MVRIQVQFTEAQIKALRQLSAETGSSIAELTRDAVEQFLVDQGRRNQQAIIDRALSVIGAFNSGSNDGSSDHEAHLADAFS